MNWILQSSYIHAELKELRNSLFKKKEKFNITDAMLILPEVDYCHRRFSGNILMTSNINSLGVYKSTI